MAGVKIKKKNVSDDIRKSSRLIVEALARNTESETKKQILRGTKTGEMYRVPKTSRMYQASAPGEAPANRTGALARSYNSQVLNDNTSIVYSQLKYSKIEFGWGSIKPRPHLRPANNITMKKKDAIIKTILMRFKDK